jgi:hypothetical protein
MVFDRRTMGCLIAGVPFRIIFSYILTARGGVPRNQPVFASPNLTSTII